VTEHRVGDSIDELFAAARAGERQPLARLLSYIERGGDEARHIGQLAFPLAGSGYTVGITGAPGAGKSTLTSALVSELRADGLPAAVLAIDPSSPFTGGAILGDRVRMQDHALDPDVFIRSMATRGHLGGLALAAPAAVRMLEAAGRPWVLLETVGVGQVEVEIVGAADTTVVVVNPGWGDAVQANKAGLMEIADIFVINKSDRAGAEDTKQDLEHMLDLSGLGHEGRWRPPIISTVAVAHSGVDELWAAINRHRTFIDSNGELEQRRIERTTDELERIIRARIESQVQIMRGSEAFADAKAEVLDRRLDPWEAADLLFDPTADSS
jgi:LAO/AO transport system kinase